MMHRLIALSLAGILLTGAALCSDEHNPTLEGKKLIKMFGLDKPTTAYLKENIEQIEAIGLDGVCVVVMPNEGTHEINPRHDGNYLWFTSNSLKREEFSDAVRDLNETNFRKLDYNIMQYATRGSKNPAWFDDAAWEILYENTRIAGWIVSQTPLVGITYDPEFSGGGIWNYHRIATREGEQGEAYDAYYEKARQRGREWAAALTETAPDIVVALAFGSMWAEGKVETDDTNPRTLLREQSYALWPPFIDGMLEGLGPEAQIFDGLEHTYPVMIYDTFMAFRRLAQEQNEKLSSVPDLMRKRMQYANAVWPGFRSDRGGMWDPDRPEQNHFSPERLEHALHNGMMASDKFTWMWSGRDLWWPMSSPPRSVGEAHNWGVLTLYTEPYHAAIRNARRPKDLAWLPRAPDTGSYPDAARPPHPLEGYEVLQDLPSSWWFKTSPDNRVYEHADAYSKWAGTLHASVDEQKYGWKRIGVEQPWEEQGVPYDGVALYRARVTPPDAVQGRRLWLAFGGASNRADVYAARQGTRTRILGTHEGEGPFLVDATGAFFPGEETVVVVRVINPEGPGGLLAPVKLVGKAGETSYVPEPGTYAVLDLDLGEESDGVIMDRSRFKNHASKHGGQWAEGPAGRRALRLNGTSESVSIADHPSLSPWNGTRSWELLWSPGGEIPQSPIVYHILLAKHPTYFDGLYLDQLHEVRTVYFNQGSAEQAVSYVLGDLNAWYHIIGTYDGKDMTLYVNGEQVGSRLGPIPPAVNTRPVTLGGGAIDANRCAPGIYSKAAVYNHALSAQEVSERYAACSP